MSNPKTTLSGIATIMAAVASAIHAYTTGQPVDIATLIAAVTAGIGLITAHDAPPAPKSKGGTIGSVPPAAALVVLLALATSACGTAGAVNGTFPLPTVDGVSCSTTLQAVTVNTPPADCVKTVTTQCVGPNASTVNSTVNVNIPHGNPPACP